jgi:hypothetical protein
MHSLFAFCFAFGLLLTGCEKKKIAPEVPILQKQQEKVQAHLIEIDGEIKGVQDDPIAAAALNEEKELAKSRLERIKEQLIRNGVGEAAGAAAPAGHH